MSHASEDKDAFVRPLYHELLKIGCTVWFDEYELKIGDSIMVKINEGIVNSRRGIVVLSPSFLRESKKWPKEELDGFQAKVIAGDYKILPIWHEVGLKEVTRAFPTIAGKIAADSGKKSIAEIAKDLRDALG